MSLGAISVCRQGRLQAYVRTEHQRYKIAADGAHTRGSRTRHHRWPSGSPCVAHFHVPVACAAAPWSAASLTVSSYVGTRPSPTSCACSRDAGRRPAVFTYVNSHPRSLGVCRHGRLRAHHKLCAHHFVCVLNYVLIINYVPIINLRAHFEACAGNASNRNTYLEAELMNPHVSAILDSLQNRHGFVVRAHVGLHWFQVNCASGMQQPSACAATHRM